MGTHKSVSGFSKAINGYGKAISHASRDAVGDAAQVVKTAVMAEVVRAAGADLKMRNWGVNAKGYPLSVGYDVKGTTGRVVALVKTRGAIAQWHLLEGGAAPHTILPKGTGRAKNRTKAGRHAAKQDLYNALFGGGGGQSASPMHTPYGPRYKVKHPGMGGKYPWRAGVESSRDAAQKIIAAQYLRAFRKGSTGGII